MYPIEKVSGTFTDMILGGTASDGGLLVPEKYEVISEERLAQWQNLPYPELLVVLLSQQIYKR